MFRFTNPWMVEVINGCAKSCHNYTFHWLLFFRLFHRRIEMFERSLEAASLEAVCSLAPEQAAKSILSSPTHQGVRSNNSDERANNCDPAMFIRQYQACINPILTTGSGQIHTILRIVSHCYLNGNCEVCLGHVFSDGLMFRTTFKLGTSDLGA